MSSWRCTGCRTVYAPGIPACPHCVTPAQGSVTVRQRRPARGRAKHGKGGIVAHSSAEGGSTLYVGEGQPVPGDAPDGVRLVGPGVPVDEAEAVAAEEVPAAAEPPVPDDAPAPAPRKPPAPAMRPAGQQG